MIKINNKWKHTEEEMDKMKQRKWSQEERERNKLLWTVEKKELERQKILNKKNPFYGKHHTEEFKKEAKKRHTGTNWALGVKLSTDVKQLLRNQKLGKKHTKEHKENIKNGMNNLKVKKAISEANLGKILSLETRQKMKNDFIIHPKRRENLIEARKNRIFPKKDTSIEIKIREFLDVLQIEYFQHKYININHGYQCDFFIPSKNLVIECDGDYWHKYPAGRDIDKVRTSELIEKGFKVLRLWENEIIELNLETFKKKLETPHAR